jgi:hypothetical protein
LCQKGGIAEDQKRLKIKNTLFGVKEYFYFQIVYYTRFYMCFSLSL